MTAFAQVSCLPANAGVGLRHPHIAEMLERRPSVGWLEVHAENFMNDSAAADDLETLRSAYPISLHGVGLSLGSAEGICETHLSRLQAVVERYQPAQVSEHLSWSVHDGAYLNNLLPLPLTEEALSVVARNVERLQERLQRRVLIENPSAYLDFKHATMSEPEFLCALVRRTGCGLLLDVNNVYVTAHNLGLDALAYLRALPANAVGEVHLAGHRRIEGEGGPLLIDDHGSRVARPVWALYREALHMTGPQPTLIEWDSALPPLTVLLEEAARADLLADSVASSNAADRDETTPARTPANCTTECDRSVRSSPRTQTTQRHVQALNLKEVRDVFA